MRRLVLSIFPLVLVFQVFAAPAFAAAGLTNFTEAQSLGELISGLYDYSRSIVGLVVFGMFLYAGLQLIITGDKAKAQKIIQDAVIGTILLYAAAVILGSINHDLIGQ